MPPYVIDEGVDPLLPGCALTVPTPKIERFHNKMRGSRCSGRSGLPERAKDLRQYGTVTVKEAVAFFNSPPSTASCLYTQITFTQWSLTRKPDHPLGAWQAWIMRWG